MFTSNRSNSFIATLLVALAALTSACISNDLPYPWVLPSVGEVTVVAVDADGHDLLDGPVQIDSATQSIVVPLSEWANIEAVDISSIRFSDGTTCPDENIFSRPLNLTSPVEFRLEKYGRTTTWTISATQTIERVFTVGSQIGASQIDVDARTATAAVPTGQPLDAIAVRTLKLAGPSATYSPDIAGQTVDFTQPVKVTVTEYGQSTEWTLTVVQTDVSVAIDRIDAWTQVAWIYASAEEGKSNGLEYRRADGDPDQWTAVPADWITEQGGSFTVRLIHLDPQTSYVVRATSDDDHSAELQFTTGLNLQLPNSDFTQWHQDGKVWNPWAAGGTSFWDTGNRGATTLGNSNTTPIESAQSSTGYAGAMLETKFVGISIL
ncbi:MAG: PCMD domain-containing protein, partial [Paramuribaculum sp.]|nr:PCMD domain-containing protein [Paramuribaculum sp.]